MVTQHCVPCRAVLRLAVACLCRCGVPMSLLVMCYRPPMGRTHHTDGQVGLSRRRHPGLSAAFQRITAPPHPASESAHAEAAMQSRSHAATQPCLVLKMCKLSVRKRVCMISSIVANRSWCSPLSCKTHAPVRAQRDTHCPHAPHTPHTLRTAWVVLHMHARSLCTHAV
jgi:hypothetical protein